LKERWKTIEKRNGGVHISGYRRFAAKRRSKFRLLHIPFILDVVQRRGKKTAKNNGRHRNSTCHILYYS